MLRRWINMTDTNSLVSYLASRHSFWVLFKWPVASEVCSRARRWNRMIDVRSLEEKEHIHQAVIKASIPRL